MSVYIIGPVFGAALTLKALLAKLPKDANIVFTGNIIDKGPRSKEVLELVANHYPCVLGEREDLLLKSDLSKEDTFVWLMSGGNDTVKSLGVDENGYCEIPEAIWSWLTQLPDEIVHSGIVIRSQGPKYEKRITALQLPENILHEQEYID